MVPVWEQTLATRLEAGAETTGRAAMFALDLTCGQEHRRRWENLSFVLRNNFAAVAFIHCWNSGTDGCSAMAPPLQSIMRQM